MTNPIPINRGRLIALPLLCSFLFAIRFSQAQCIASGPMGPATSTDVSYAGSDYSFNTPSNALLDDNNNTVAASVFSLFSKQTDYLQVKGFGFNIPTGATICGIEVNVVKSAANVLLNLATVTDYNVRILKNGTLTGSNMADGTTQWSSTETTTTYGGNGQLWSASWTPSDINSNNFGFSIAAEINTTVSLFPSAQINYISMTVYYLPPIILAAQNLSFDVTTGANHTALLSWKPNTEEPTSFVVERSGNGTQWEALAETPQKNTLTRLYSLTDTRPLNGHSFYRLKSINTAGQAAYSTVIPFEIANAIALKGYPNPFTASIAITGITPGERVTLTNIYGQRVLLSPPATSNILTIDAHDLQPGMYVICAGNKKMKVQKK